MDWHAIDAIAHSLEALALTITAAATWFAALIGYRGLEKWREEAIVKRKAELAEQTLADFYRARDIIVAARLPLIAPGEGLSRPRRKSESDEGARDRDAAYVPFERLMRESVFFSIVYSKRFQFMTMFGPHSDRPFIALNDIYTQIGTAAQRLSDDRIFLDDAERREYQRIIGWDTRGGDPVKERIDAMIAEVEAICHHELPELSLGSRYKTR